MAIWAIVAVDKFEIQVGCCGEFTNKPLVAVDEGPLKEYQDALPYSVGKWLRVVELVEKTRTR